MDNTTRRQSSDAPPPKPQLLEEKIVDASRWSVGLGVITLIGGVLQIFSTIDIDVPIWLNLGGPAALIAFGLMLQRRSLLLAVILFLLFVAMIVNTLVVTGETIESGGLLPTAVLVIRYIVLVKAGRAIGLALFGMLEFQRTEVEPDKFRSSPKQSPARGDRPASAPAPRRVLEPGVNGAAVYFAVYAVFMCILGAVLLFAEAFEDLFAPLKLVPFAFAGVIAYFAVLESRIFPQKAQELRTAIAGHDEEKARKVLDLLRSKGRRASRALAIAALAAHSRRDPGETPFMVAAFDMIGEIGLLEKDAAEAIYGEIVAGQHDEAGVVAAAARRALQSVGYNMDA